MTPAPGLLRQILCRVLYDHNQRLAPVAIDQPLTDGETLKSLEASISFMLLGIARDRSRCSGAPGRMLFAADVFMNIMGLGDLLGFEDIKMGRASQSKLAGLSFDAVGFGHGNPVVREATRYLRKWKKS
jgi:hypothetical protein